jgi:ferredoxin
MSSMADGVTVTIDREECIECGVCWSTCPEFFEPGDDGWSQVVAEYRVHDSLAHGQAPAMLEDCVNEGADGCPVSIIHVGG